MATCKHLPLCAFILIQGVWGMPATVSVNTPSYGTQFQENFKKNLATVMSNLHNGVTSMSGPSIKFMMDTVPNVIQQGIHTTTEKVNKLTDAGKEGFQKLGVGAGQAIGGGGVLGSSIAGGALQVAGHGLGVGVDVADAGAKAGIDFLGHLGDNAASGLSVGTTVGGNALSTLGNGMITAGTGVSVLSNGLSTLLDVVGAGLSNGVNKTEQAIVGLLDAGVLQLENGILSFSTSAQANVYNILNSFLEILVNVQKLFNSLRVDISTNTSASGVAGSGNAGTGGTAASSTAAGQNAASARLKAATAGQNAATTGLKAATAGQKAATAARLVRDLPEPQVEELQTENVETQVHTEDIETVL